MIIHNVRRNNQTLVNCIKLFLDVSKIQDMITHRYNLEQVQDAFEISSNYSEEIIKCMVLPNS